MWSAFPNHNSPEPVAVDVAIYPVESVPLPPSVPQRSFLRLRLCLAGLDIAAIAMAFAAGTAINAAYNPGDPTSPSAYAGLWALSLPIWTCVFAYLKLYRIGFLGRWVDEAVRIVRAVGVGLLVTSAMAPVVKLDIGRTWLVCVGGSLLVGLVSERWVVRRVLDRMRYRGMLLRPVLVAGLNEEGLLVRQVITSDPRLGYEFVGFVEDLIEGEHLGDASPLDNPGAVLQLAERLGVGSVIVAATAIDVGSSNRLIRSLTEHGLHVEISSTLCDIASDRLTVRPIGRLPVLYIEPSVRDGWRARAKRAFDVVVAAAALVVATPVIVASMILVKCSSSGPVLFRQHRVGLDGRLFEILKLRTMVVDAEDRLADLEHLNEADGVLFKLRDDPRITRVDRWLRTLSIDELPQLVNVIRGEMSLVGPRPALPHESERWSPELYRRVRVRPGITGMWQVSGRSQSGGHDTEYTRLDLYYVDNWSLLADLAILARTVPAVFGRRGQY